MLVFAQRCLKLSWVSFIKFADTFRAHIVNSTPSVQRERPVTYKATGLHVNTGTQKAQH